MDKKDFLVKLKKFDVGNDFHKKSLVMIERLFDKGIDAKSQKAGMEFVLKIYKNQADFRKKTEKIKESLKDLKNTKPAVKKKGFFRRR